MLLVDTHVHLYPCYAPGMVFDAAHANLAKWAEVFHSASCWTGVLCVAEIAGQDWWGRFRDAASGEGLVPPVAGGWRFRRTAEADSLNVEAEGGRRLLLIASRQIVTLEGLEVLGVGIDRSVPDGLSFEACLAELDSQGAVPIIPWGFGKWAGARGRVLRRYLTASCGKPRALLGDSGGRPSLLGEPSLFRVGRECGVPVVAGSDPLPLSWDAARAGAYGTAIASPIDEDRPSDALKRLLKTSTAVFTPFGNPAAPWPFLRNQVMLRLNRRGARAFSNGHSDSV